jgi:probable HAF family extracellular repeat protein
MLLPTFVRRWMNSKAFASPRARQTTTRSARRRVRLHLEPLEARCLPSGYNFITLDVPGSTFSTATGINNVGQIVGQYFSEADGRTHGFLLSGGSYTTLDVPGSTGTVASGINDSGQIVGDYVDAGGRGHGFLYSGGNYTTLDVPGSTFTEALGINNSGQIVGAYENPGQHGFLLSGGNYTTLDVPGAAGTVAGGINDAGEIVGDTGGPLGFLLSGGSYTTFTVPGSQSTTPSKINNLGQIVGSYNTGDTHGFLLSGGSYTTLDMPGSQFTFAYGINDTGQIVGDGDLQAFLATPVAPSVTCSVADSQLWPPNQELVNVGLSVQVSDPKATLQVQVFANDNARASDAADLDPSTLRLRSDRQGDGSGRVYLIVVTATDAAGDVAFGVCTVVVPHDQSAGALSAVEQQAADAEAYFQAIHTAPPGYALLG